MSQEGRCSKIGVRERNAVGAVKAIAAASLALHGDGQAIRPIGARYAHEKEATRWPAN
jgi:uncharacterized DUF497 family protein